MFHIFRKPLEDRLLQCVWDIPGGTENVLPINLSDPKGIALFQSSISLANLSLACAVLFTRFDRTIATKKVKIIESRVIASIGAVDLNFLVSDVLKLESERNAWITWSGSPIDGIHSYLHSILDVVWARRLSDYQSDIMRGMDLYRRGGAQGFGPLVFLTKRFLSHRTGLIIDPRSSLPEDGLSHFLEHSIHFMGILQIIQKTVMENE